MAYETSESILNRLAVAYLKNQTEVYCMAQCPDIPVPVEGAGYIVWTIVALLLLFIPIRIILLLLRFLHVREISPSLTLSSKLRITLGIRPFPAPILSSNPAPFVTTSFITPSITSPCRMPVFPPTPSPTPLPPPPRCQRCRHAGRRGKC